jgi:DNA repair protein RecO (recombination protein O)
MFKDKVICLSKIKYGESDLILKLISSQGQVYSAIAKSALKSKKRFGGGILEPTHYMNLTLSHDPQNLERERMPAITEGNLITEFPLLKQDYDKLTLALHMVQVVAKVGREGDLQKELFDLLGHSLKACEERSDLLNLQLQFEIKMLHIQGVLPPHDRYADYLRSSIRQPLSTSSAHEIAPEITHWLSNYLS